MDQVFQSLCEKSDTEVILYLNGLQKYKIPSLGKVDVNNYRKKFDDKKDHFHTKELRINFLLKINFWYQFLVLIKIYEVER